MADETPGTVDDTGTGRPTVWIALTILFALAAIGLAIWGFSKKSDLDDTKDKLAQQEQQAGQTESADVALDDAEKARYRAVRRRLIAARHQERDLNAQVHTERAQYDQAKTDLANANTEEERQQAQLNVLTQRHELAAACARGAVASYDDLIEATTASAGAKKAIGTLQGLQSDCDDVIA
jgi:chromosome segregation ATPase